MAKISRSNSTLRRTKLGSRQKQSLKKSLVFLLLLAVVVALVAVLAIFQKSTENRSQATGCAAPTAPVITVPATTAPPGTYNITWGPVSGAVRYDLRVNDESTPWGACSTTYGGDLCASQTTTSKSHTFVAGKTYNIWVDVANGCGSYATGIKRITVTGGSSPAPTPVPSPSPTCATPATPVFTSPATTIAPGTYTVSWGAVSGATRYDLRIDDETNPWGACTGSQSGDACSSQTATTYTHTFTAGHTYNMWVDVGNACGRYATGVRRVTVTGGASPVPSPVPTPTGGSGAPARAGYTLIFNDEFDCPMVDNVNSSCRTQFYNKWFTRYVYSGGTQDRLNPDKEIQQYRDNGNHVVSNGTLKLIANKLRAFNPSNPAAVIYESGMIRTKTAFQGRHYIEARVKLPNTQNQWSAFWAMPRNEAWPPELDIMESWSLSSTYHHIKNANMSYSLLNRNNHPSVSAADSVGALAYVPPNTNFSQGFHTFGLEWNDNIYTIYADGIRLGDWQIDGKDRSGNPAGAMDAVLNLAILNWTQDAGYPQQQIYEVDYVRLYQKN